MTIPATSRRAGPFPGNGVSTSFPFSFKVLGTSPALSVLVNDGGTESVIPPTGYTVVVNPDQNTTPGGAVVLPLPLAAGAVLAILDNTPADQQTALPTGGAYRAKVHETAFDKLTILVQRLIEGFNRTLRLPATAGEVSTQLPVPKPGGLLGWDSLGGAVTNYAPGDLAISVAYATAYVDLFTGDGVADTFTLSDDPGVLGNLDVSIAGITQIPGVDFLWSGTSIEFTTPPASGARVLVRYMQSLPMGAGGTAAGVTYKATATSTSTRNVQDKLDDSPLSAFDFMTPAQIADVKARTRLIDVSLAVQRFFDACRGRSGYLPPGDYRCDNEINVEALHPTEVFGAGFNSDSAAEGSFLRFTSGLGNGINLIYSYAQWAPGGGADAHTAYDVANGIPALGNADNRVVLRGFGIKGPGNTAAKTTRSVQLHLPGPTTVGTGNGIFAYWAGAAQLKDLWVSDWPGHGLIGYMMFSLKVQGGYYVNNTSSGISLLDAANNVKIRDALCIGNGRMSGAFANYNCYIGQLTNSPNYGVSLQDVDFESAGLDAAPGHAFASITSISVTGGVATMVLPSAPAWSVGHFIGLWGGTAANGNKVLNSVTPYVIKTKVGNTVTFDLPGVAGSFSVAGLRAGPFTGGVCLDNCYGATVKGYIEGSIGPAVTVNANCRGVEVSGFHSNNSPIYVEGWRNGIGIGTIGGGTGYAVNNVLTAAGLAVPPGGSAVTLRVTSVGAGGAITGLVYETNGRVYSAIDGSYTLTGGSGTGASANLSFGYEGPSGVVLHSNQFQGAGGGIYLQHPMCAVVGPNAYVRSGTETPFLYLGADMANISAAMPETGTVIAQGLTTHRGINQYVGPSTPGHESNTITGLAAGLNLQDSFNNGVGRQNTIYGYRAGAALTAGYNNALVGSWAGHNLTTGFQNMAFGNRALNDGTTNANYIAIGHSAARGASAGNNVVAIGLAAGQLDTVQSDNGNGVYIGNNAARRSGAAAPWTDCTVIGYQGSVWTGGAVIGGIAIGKDSMLDPDFGSTVTVIGSQTTTTRTKYWGPLVSGNRYTVATLPAGSASLDGARAYVTDSNTSTFYAPVVGGGALRVPVYYDGNTSTWRVG